MIDRVDPIVGLALASCVRGERGPDLQRAVELGLLGPLIDAGRFHRVLNLVHLVVADLIDEEDPKAIGLKRYYVHQVGHHLRALEDLAWLGRVLDERGVSWVLVKGPVLSEVVYERSDLRVYQDLDIVIAPDAYTDAIDALESAGCELLDRNWDVIRREGRAQLHVSLRLGTVADVHRHLLNRAIVRHSFAVPMGDLFARARTVTVGAVTVKTLDPVDTLLHLCIHASLAGAHQLLWLKDVDESVRREAPSWEDVLVRARSWRAAPIVAVVLGRARDVLRTPVPSDVLRSLFRSKLRGGAAISAFLDRRWPTYTAGNGVTPAVVWAQVVRDTWGTTSLALIRRLTRPVLNAVRGRDPTEPRGSSEHEVRIDGTGRTVHGS